MPRCFVAGCKSGYDTTMRKNKLKGLRNESLFAVPKNRDLIQQWQRVIPRIDRVLTSKDLVCEKHFREEDILRYYEERMPDGSLFVLERGNPRLANGAVPCIFSRDLWHKPSSNKNSVKGKKTEKGKKPEKRKRPSSIRPKAETYEKELIICEPSADCLETCMEGLTPQEGISFEFLKCEIIPCIRMPNNMWTFNSLPQYIAWLKWDHDHSIVKKVLITESLQIKVYRKEKEFITLQFSDIMTDVEDLQRLLDSVDALVA